MKYALWLWNIPGISSGKIRRMMEYAGSAEEIYGWPEHTLSGLKILKEEEKRAIRESKQKWDPEQEWSRLQEAGISFVSLEQKDYPKRLRNIHNPPYGLYYKGRLPDTGKKSVAVVGARGRSEYGRMVAHKLGESLGKRGISVISGLARGIDSDGHAGALHGGGSTFAVLGCGVDICYPRSNQGLYDKILEYKGGIISEYPPGHPPLAGQFPGRNRIISGLSDCVVIVEAREKSGSLITADFAMEQGRDVYAVPGRLGDSLSWGCNQLIHQGAGIFLDVEEFLQDLDLLEENSCVQMDFRKNLLEKDEMVVYSLLDFCPKGLGGLLEESSFSLSKLLEVLAVLENKGFAKETIPNFYIRC